MQSADALYLLLFSTPFAIGLSLDASSHRNFSCSNGPSSNRMRMVRNSKKDIEKRWTRTEQTNK